MDKLNKLIIIWIKLPIAVYKIDIVFFMDRYLVKNISPHHIHFEPINCLCINECPVTGNTAQELPVTQNGLHDERLW